MKKAAMAVLLGFMAVGCTAEVGGAPPEDTPATTASELRANGITLKNHATRTVDGGPATLKVTVSAGSANATVKESSLATCTMKIDHAASTAAKTIFQIAIEYELDDGWNGCTIEFTAPGYASTLDVGLNIDT